MVRGFNSLEGATSCFSPEKEGIHTAMSSFGAVRVTLIGFLWMASLAAAQSYVPGQFQTLAEAYAAAPVSGVRIILTANYTITTPEIIQLGSAKQLVIDLNGRKIICSNPIGTRCLTIWQNVFIAGMRTTQTVIHNGSIRYEGDAVNTCGIALGFLSQAVAAGYPSYIGGFTNVTLDKMILEHFPNERSFPLCLDGVQELTVSNSKFTDLWGAVRAIPSIYGSSSAVKFDRVGFQEITEIVLEGIDGPGGLVFDSCNIQGCGRGVGHCRNPIVLESRNTSIGSIWFNHTQWETNGDTTSATSQILLKAGQGMRIEMPVFRDTVINAGPYGMLGSAIEFQGDGQLIGPLRTDGLKTIAIAPGRLLKGMYTTSLNSIDRVSMGGNDATGLLTNPSEPFQVFGRSTFQASGNGIEALRIKRYIDAFPAGNLISVRNAGDTQTIASLDALGHWDAAGYKINGVPINLGGQGGSVQFVAVPASKTAPCAPGDLAENNNYLFVCIGTNSWRRTPLSVW